MKAIFCIRFENGAPIMPPQDDNSGGLHLAYTDKDGQRHGGWAIIGQAPPVGHDSVLVLVHSTDAVVTALQKRADYLGVKTLGVTEQPIGEEPVAPAKTARRRKASAKVVPLAGAEAVKAAMLLKTWRFPAATVDAKLATANTADRVAAVVLELHGVKAADLAGTDVG